MCSTRKRMHIYSPSDFPLLFYTSKTRNLLYSIFQHFHTRWQGYIFPVNFKFSGVDKEKLTQGDVSLKVVTLM